MKLLEVADSVSLEEVNAIGASVLSYISHYRNEAALLEEVGPDPVSKGYAQPGPSRMTSIVACVPAFMDASGQSTGRTSPMSAWPIVYSQVMPVVSCQLMLVVHCQVTPLVYCQLRLVSLPRKIVHVDVAVCFAWHSKAAPSITHDVLTLR